MTGLGADVIPAMQQTRRIIVGCCVCSGPTVCLLGRRDKPQRARFCKSILITETQCIGLFFCLSTKDIRWVRFPFVNQEQSVKCGQPHSQLLKRFLLKQKSEGIRKSFSTTIVCNSLAAMASMMFENAWWRPLVPGRPPLHWR